MVILAKYFGLDCLGNSRSRGIDQLGKLGGWLREERFWGVVLDEVTVREDGNFVKQGDRVESMGDRQNGRVGKLVLQDAVDRPAAFLVNARSCFVL